MKIRFQAIGADPELFFRRKDGTPQSSEGLVGGTKVAPQPIPNLADGFAVQEDNVAVEFNIPPAVNAVEFSNAIAKAIAYVNKIAKAKVLTLSYQSALHFPIDQLKTAHAQNLGCDPDFNAWTELVNPKPEPPTTMRTAAGHVHVSWYEPKKEEKIAIVKAMDLFLTVPSIVATATPHPECSRRSLYGKAGACRPKPYGVEHRSLDNFWIAEPLNRKHVFNETIRAIDWLCKDANDALVELDNWAPEIQQCINSHDKDKAIFLMDYFALRDFPVRHAA